MKTQLELTDDQVNKLQALHNAPHPKRNEAELMRARADMLDATQGDGDLTKARAALDKMSRLRNDEQLAHLKERQDVRNVLTAAQKTTLDNMRGMMRDRVRDRMRGGMKAGMQQRTQQRMRQHPGMGAGQGFAPGGRRRGMGAPGGDMGPGMGRRGRSIEPDVNVDTRQPVPPSDSLSIR